MKSPVHSALSTSAVMKLLDQGCRSPSLCSACREPVRIHTLSRQKLQGPFPTCWQYQHCHLLKYLTKAANNNILTSFSLLKTLIFLNSSLAIYASLSCLFLFFIHLPIFRSTSSVECSKKIPTLYILYIYVYIIMYI